MALSSRETRLEEHKDQVVKALSVQFSQNALSVEEYERLLDYINRVESERELAIVEKVIEETALYAGDSEPIPHSRYSSVPRKSDLTLLASRNFSGQSLRARRSILTILGNSHIHIQKGDLPPGRTEVKIVCLLGNMAITVPRDVAVIIEAIPILGGVFVARGVASQKIPGCPELLITGGAYLGNISIKAEKESLKDKILHTVLGILA